MGLAGTVEASWSLTQEVAGSSPFTVMMNILSLNSVKTFRENSISPLAFGSQHKLNSVWYQVINILVWHSVRFTIMDFTSTNLLL